MARADGPESTLSPTGMSESIDHSTSPGRISGDLRQLPILNVANSIWPADWAGEFGRQAALHVEVGFGNGLFLVGMAARMPEDNFIGIELAIPSIQKAASRIKRDGSHNVRLIRGSAESVLLTMFEPQSIGTMYVNYPDPWPKARHQNRRLLNHRLLRLVSTRLVPNGHLFIATDHEEYATVIAALIDESVHFEAVDADGYSFSNPHGIVTKYEQRAKRLGDRSFYFRLQNRLTSEWSEFAIPKEYPMPHILIEHPLTPAEIAERLSPDSEEPAAGIRLIALYVNSAEPEVLFDMRVQDEALEQRIAVTLRERGDGSQILRVHSFGHPRSTKRVHEALALLVKKIIALSSEARISHHNLTADL